MLRYEKLASSPIGLVLITIVLGLLPIVVALAGLIEAGQYRQQREIQLISPAGSMLRDTLSKQLVTLYRMAIAEDKAARDKERAVFLQLSERIAEDSAQVAERVADNAQLLAQWRQIETLLRANAKQLEETLRLSTDNQPSLLWHKLNDEVEPVQEAIISALDALAKAEFQHMRKNLARFNQNKRLYYAAALVFAAIVLLLALLLAWSATKKNQARDEYNRQQADLLRQLYALAGSSQPEMAQLIRESLALGCRLLDMEIGKVCRIDTVDKTNTFLYTVSPEEFNVAEGTEIPLDKSFCAFVVQKQEAVALQHVADSPYRQYPCYEFSQLEAYIAVPLYLDGEVYGTVDFSNRHPRATPFCAADVGIAQQIADWIGVVLAQERVQKQLSDAKDTAELSNRAKSGFLARVSHEIRTPLTAILGFAQSLQDPALAQEQKQHAVSTILRSGLQLHQFVDDIVDLAKIEAQQLELEVRETSLFALLLQLNGEVAGKARAKGVNFQIHYQFPLPDKILTDPVRLKQVLLNICDNAVKFTDKGGATLEVRFQQLDGKLQFVITDTGIGMTAEEMESNFTAFSQPGMASVRAYHGMGLGLCIAQELVKALKGAISCESKKDKGSQFSVDIPCPSTVVLVDDFGAAQLQTESKNALPVNQSFRGSVLLAEDNPDNQQLISMYITRAGATVTLAENGKTAVHHAMSEEFELILMDMQMPVMGGLEAIQWLRKMGCGAPIVALTANALKQDRERCLEAGADDYLTKPIDLERFYAILTRYLSVDAPAPASSNGASNHAAPVYDFTNDPEYKLLVQSFVERLPTVVENIRHAISEKQWNEVQKLSHNLKGIGASMGFPQISEVAKKINLDAKQSAHTLIDSLTAELAELSERICRENRARQVS